jgi:DNA-binding transcriptional regulator YiaG
MAVHRASGQAARRKKGAPQTQGVTRFQRLMQDWLDAEPSRNPRDLGRAAGLDSGLIYQRLSKPLSTRRPDEKTITALGSVLAANAERIKIYIARDLGLVADPEMPRSPAAFTASDYQGLRLALGVSADALAAAIGVEPGVVKSWETGAAVPELDAYERLRKHVQDHKVRMSDLTGSIRDSSVNGDLEALLEDPAAG